MKTNEGLFLISKCACEDTMKKIERLYGPFSDDEIRFYEQRLSDEKGNVINEFQKSLVFNLFYKYFGDTVSINNINKIDYIKLVIAASRLLKKIETYILELMATIVASKFQIIDYEDPTLDGQIHEFSSDIIYNEIAMYVTLIW